MPNQWTIHSTAGGKDNSDLQGCHIQVNGNTYQFTQPNIQSVLSTTTETTLPTPPFAFPAFQFGAYTWTIIVTTLTGGHGNNKAEGTWTNTDPSITADESGTWTAQAGGTIDPEEDAASAKA